MGKGNDFRTPRRRGFDDEMPAPYMPRNGGGPRAPQPYGGGGGGGGGFGGGGGGAAAVADGPVVDAIVKWFKADKGFGFCEMTDGSGDAFLHIRALEAAGHASVPPGAKLKVQVGQGAKGPQVTRVVSVDASSAVEPAPRSAPRGPRPGGGGRYTPDTSSAVELEGTVKWFNTDKGFGFVAIADGGKDVFIHASVLGEAGLAGLAEGQRVMLRVVDTPKGREAVSISLG